ncbi:MAG: repair protein RecO [Candidatus Atribacteria bacterium]|nr:repair protein RecO [Candidatus Atribacteria bacterium]
MGLLPLTRDRCRYWKDEGVLLGSFPFGETDRIVTLFTRQRGKIRVIAKGARKVGNRFGISLDFFSYSSFFLYSGKGLPMLIQASLQESYRSLVNSPRRWGAGHYLLYLVDRCFEMGEPCPRIAEEIKSGWRICLEREDKDIEAMLIKFLLDLIFYMGFTPSFSNCIACQKAVPSDSAFWDNRRGGVLCAECGPGEMLLPPYVLPILRQLQLLPLTTAATTLSLSASQRSFLGQFLTKYLEHHIGERIISWDHFLAKIKAIEVS